MNLCMYFESIRRNLSSLTIVSNAATVTNILQDLRFPNSHFPDTRIKKRNGLEMWNTSARNTNSPESESGTSAQEMTTIWQKLRPAGEFTSKHQPTCHSNSGRPTFDWLSSLIKALKLMWQDQLDRRPELQQSCLQVQPLETFNLERNLRGL